MITEADLQRAKADAWEEGTHAARDAEVRGARDIFNPYGPAMMERSHISIQGFHWGDKVLFEYDGETYRGTIYVWTSETTNHARFFPDIPSQSLYYWKTYWTNNEVDRILYPGAQASEVVLSDIFTRLED